MLEESEKEQQECRYIKNTEIIELDTESLHHEIEISKTLRQKLNETKYYYHFSYIIDKESINLNEMKQEEIIKCDLPMEKEKQTSYVLCTYTNRPTTSIKLTDFLMKKATEVDIKIFIKIIMDFHITLQESLKGLYNLTNIVHFSINENNIIVSEEEQIPIIKNFKKAKIMEVDEKIDGTNETATTWDILSLTKTLLNIINKITNIKDETGILTRYKEKLTKIINEEPSKRIVINLYQ